MPRTLPETDTYTPNITVPLDGEPFNAAVNDGALKGINDRVVNHEGRLNSRDAEVDQLRNDVDANDADIASLRTDLDAAEAEIVTLQSNANVRNVYGALTLSGTSSNGVAGPGFTLGTYVTNDIFLSPSVAPNLFSLGEFGLYEVNINFALTVTQERTMVLVRQEDPGGTNQEIINRFRGAEAFNCSWYLENEEKPGGGSYLYFIAATESSTILAENSEYKPQMIIKGLGPLP